MIYLIIFGALFISVFFIVIGLEIIASRHTHENNRISKVLQSSKVSSEKHDALAVFQNKEQKNKKTITLSDNIAYLFSAPLALGTYFFMKNIESSLSPAMQQLVFILPLAVFILLPFFHKKILKESRKMEILTLLPVLIDLLTICIEAGLSFSMGIEKIIQETPIKSKFFFKNLNIAVLEMNAGVEKSIALHALVKRCYNNNELKSFVSAVLQSEAFGFSIAKTLQTQSYEIREKKRQTIRTKIAKMPITLLFPLIFCIAPITCILLAGPGIIDILSSF